MIFECLLLASAIVMYSKSFSLADGIILSSATHLLHIALIKIKDICNSNRILIAKSILKNKEMLR